MKIALVSDMHLSMKEQYFRGVDVKKNFLEVLSEVKNNDPELLIYMGDFCMDEPEPEVYHWVKKETDALNTTTFAIPGNHDDQSILAKTFSLPFIPETGEICYGLDLGFVFLLFSDSSKATISNDQLKWLIENCSDEKPVLWFTHYPPVKCGCLYMDTNHAFIDSDKNLHFLRKKHTIEHIYCGHYHTGKDLKWEEISIHITPSTCFQVDENSNDMVIHSTKPGYRVITLEDGYIDNNYIFLG